MTDTFTVRLEWRGNDLWLGPIRLGRLFSAIREGHDPRWIICDTLIVLGDIPAYHGTGAAARDALWAAAVELLTRDGAEK